MKKNICVIGFGSWGIALASLLSKNGHTVKAWEYNAEMAKLLDTEREHKLFLPGVIIPKDIIITDNIEQAATNSDIFLLVVPSNVISIVLPLFVPYFNEDSVIVSATKGFEEKTKKRISEYIKTVTNAKIVALTGPTHAEEVSKCLPTTILSASVCQKSANMIAEIFSNDSLRVYTASDIVGAELGGSLKNVIALAAGISDGLGFGDNTKAALMTRGIVEIARLGVKMGARESTFYGLSGIGDLIVTCTSKHSRNWRAGNKISQGKPINEVIKEIGMVVEGINTAKTALLLAKEHSVSMPIVEEVNKVLFEGKEPKKAVVDLMKRELISE